MGKPIKVLLIEDSVDDALLTAKALRAQGYDPEMTRVDKRDDLARALGDGASWDIIISDFHLPALTGMCALDVLKESGRDIPFILFTGTIGEDNAAAVMKAGADDFILKDRTTRLGPAIDRAMMDAHNRADRRRAVLELSELNQDLAAVIDASPLAIVVLDAGGLVRRWSRSAVHLFGWKMQEQIGQPFFPLREDAADPLRARIAGALAGRSCIDVEVKCRRKFATEGYFMISVAPLPGQGDQVRGALLIASDITERKADEHRARHAMKMESIGQLAAGIAHEIKTPLQFIGDNLRFLQQSCQELAPLFSASRDLAGADEGDAAIATLRAAAGAADIDYLAPEMPKAIDQALEGVARVATIVNALKEFSHPDSGVMALASLRQIIESTLNIARNEYKYVAEVETRFDPDLPDVECVQGELSQVILNLVVNAAHAIGDVVSKTGGKGVITIATRRLWDLAEIRVSDTGTGIPEHAQSKIFDPFFTTKEVGKGTGQGLALAHTVIVQKHRGAISFETAAGKGTTFIILIPLTQPTAPSSGPGA